MTERQRDRMVFYRDPTANTAISRVRFPHPSSASSRLSHRTPKIRVGEPNPRTLRDVEEDLAKIRELYNDPMFPRAERVSGRKELLKELSTFQQAINTNRIGQKDSQKQKS